MTEDGKEVKIIAFLCNWCAYAGADLAGVSRLNIPVTVRNIRVMCSGRVNPLLLMRALFSGADGVLVGGCHPNDCHYTRGNFIARRRFVLLKDIFKTLELEDDRIKLVWVSASEGNKYAGTIREFTETLQQMGTNPANDEMFL